MTVVTDAPNDVQDIQDLKEFNARVTKEKKKETNAGKRSDVSVDVGNASLWSVSGDSYFPCEKAIESLPPGHYVVWQSQTHGVYLRAQKLNIDDLIELPDSTSVQVIEEIERFWKLEDHFRKFGFLWKRGMLLWGPPGSGKTATIQMLANKVIQHGGIAVSIVSPGLAVAGLQIIRKIEPTRPIVGLLEDIDAVVQQHGEADLLALLDGENQVDNVVYLATTNYPERLDPRFVNRPSRFDVIKKIGMPDAAARATFISHKSPRLADDVDQLVRWVTDTDGLPISHLKELIISVEVFGVEYEQSLTRLKTMMECGSDSQEAGNLGIHNIRPQKPGIDIEVVCNNVLEKRKDTDHDDLPCLTDRGSTVGDGRAEQGGHRHQGHRQPHDRG